MGPSKAYKAAGLVLDYMVELFDDVAKEFDEVDCNFANQLRRCADACSDAAGVAREREYFMEKREGVS